MTFERHYIPQMYRIWNWILYFSLGMMVRLYHDKLRFITWKHVLAAGLVCVVLLWKKYVGLTVDEPNLNIIVNYLFVASIVTILAFAIMKLPYANKVFRL